MKSPIDHRLGVLLLLGAAVLSVCFYNGCADNTKIKCQHGISTPCIPTDKPFEHLSEYHFFEGTLSDLNPIGQLIPYDLSTPLFSDYASKLRLLYVPKGSMIPYDESGALDFPPGSVLIKNFYYPLDKRDPAPNRMIVETRLLMRNDDGWDAEVYVWNEEQTEAFRKPTGDIKEVEWIDQNGKRRKVKYIIPTKNDCKTCHFSYKELLPLGPKIRNLNKIYHYKDGDANQLERWQQAGILTGRPTLSEMPKVAVWDDPSTGSIGERARIYLDVNCAHCHNSGGAANYSGLFLSLDEQDPLHLGMCKTPVAPGPGSGGFRFDIVPCKPEQSIMIFRLESVKPQERMPELGRTLIHKEGVELIKQWIKTLSCDSCKQN